ncbi:hypothetical protein E3Q22_01289 [Wallemia mellicola]|uniref:Mitochondrial carrier n=2 Tax=Wallemia mellicola TaxID=1708541 RepID=A0A4T0NEJ6_9BASI|nr:putative mitochondrial ornithine carrier protein AmcA/Ort1 [Wallemia mellicola CBS 633.66]TIB81247.1 hypothetical protein E3Q22_01289 [Wallemia mellicola]EIM23416.1 putative mitochondrial ornithine carrier protein AmcA/Ort1 [Wallemia mellicola CBS 633.66]TIB94296.1 hypothetical protein E3Q19_00561 [Wallemia mellicola]TIC00971.1 hypothetical protein E3Q18_00903 [Wallemia mellicola]TIC03949.1 hypothetical protein E3Q17_00693 [Wallemia mellicola]|eukprot:XP_006956793.1 putative mitochondrial ornithine carrier protein AmcA/Ort1 [Wallemia mellicola CBS 633.66]
MVSSEAGSASALRDIAFGSTAGMIAKVFEHPFDLIKVRLQSQPLDRPARFLGPIDCFKQTLAGEGFLGLYRGLSMPVIGSMVENATLFVVYNQAQDVIRSMSAIKSGESLSLGQLGIAGGVAGGVTSFVLTPIEFIKCRMQVQMLSHMASAQSPHPAKTKVPGAVSLFLDTLKTRGASGLWLGQTGTFIREAGGSVAWFGAYEFLSRSFLPNGSTDKSQLKTWQLVTSGAIAGVSYNVICFPADSVKSALQTSDELGGQVVKKRFFQTGMEIYRSRGLAGLYAGMGVTIARSAPSSAMIFTIYEFLNQTF